MMAHNQDWLEWLLSLNANDVEYVIVGGVTWAEVNAHCETGRYGDAATKYISRADLIRNKRAAGRPQDIADATRLEELS